ncbi:MAG: acyl carrier protein [Deltaproteobacteria bacterium]|nr:acyl carrier protein [Deltaproteobacteria bacterium]
MDDTLIQELARKITDTLDLVDVDPDGIGADTPLFGEQGLGLDSIDVLELVVMLEQDYGVKIESKELGQQVMSTLGALAAHIRASQGGPPA